jgi:hypothetical protein
MYGLVFDCLEKFIEIKYGKKTWDEVIQKADVGIGQNKWAINENYPDDFFLKFVTILTFQLDKSFDDIVENLGSFFMDYIRWVIVSL